MMRDQDARPCRRDIVAQDVGSGPALVLIHGVGSDSRSWDKILSSLIPQFRVVTVELPGISLLRLAEEPRTLTSLALEVANAMTDRKVDQYSIVGHSYGAAVALTCAQAFSAHIQTLTLIAPGGFGPEINPALLLMTSRTGGVLLRMAQAKRVRKRVERAADRYRGRADATRSIEDLVDTYNRLSSRDAQRQFRRSVASVIETKRAFGSASIPAPPVPVQIIWGGQDLVLPVWQSETADRVLKARSVHVIPGAGHSPHSSHAAAVGHHIVEFAASSAAS